VFLNWIFSKKKQTIFPKRSSVRLWDFFPSFEFRRILTRRTSTYTPLPISLPTLCCSGSTRIAMHQRHSTITSSARICTPGPVRLMRPWHFTSVFYLQLHSLSVADQQQHIIIIIIRRQYLYVYNILSPFRPRLRSTDTICHDTS